MRPTPEYVLQIANRIVDLKASLAVAEAEWDKLFPEEVREFALAPPVEILRTPKEESGLGRIINALNQSPEVDFDPNFLSKALGIPLGTTRTSLSKLVKKGLAERRASGKYGAVTTNEKEATEVAS
jgi:hypothetical protein